MDSQGFVMGTPGTLPQAALPELVRLHHGTNLTSANELLQNGVDQKRAAASNGSGEFWVTVNHENAEWFARSNPASPPAACFEFDLEDQVIQSCLLMTPPGVVKHPGGDLEFLPSSFQLLNAAMSNRQVVAVP